MHAPMYACIRAYACVHASIVPQIIYRISHQCHYFAHLSICLTSNNLQTRCKFYYQAKRPTEWGGCRTSFGFRPQAMLLINVCDNPSVSLIGADAEPAFERPQAKRTFPYAVDNKIAHRACTGALASCSKRALRSI